MKNICSICESNSSKIFDALVLGIYVTDYFQCDNCGFIQTEKPYWLEKAYASPIASIDVGLVYRNLYLSNILPSILDTFSNKEDSYIDYGGGYGMFVRIMRDKGFDFYLHDIYAENLFAKHFELKDCSRPKKFASLTAFEVFEHLVNTVGELEKMFELSDTIIFSTELQPKATFSHAGDWWYFMPETGQHIAFYSLKSLEILSRKYNCKLYTNGNNLHIFTKDEMIHDPFIAEVTTPRSIKERVFNKLVGKFIRKPKEIPSYRTSLLQQDFQLYRSMVNNKA